MTNKTDNIKRLAVYLLITFALASFPVIFAAPMNNSAVMSFIVSEIFVCSPAIASLITRAVTKEGFRDMKLHLRLRGNLRWYLLAFAVPVLFISAQLLLPVITKGHSDWLGGFTFTNVLSSLCILVAETAVVSVRLLGEELGWRGYMNQKMEPLLGTLGTCIVGGLIWGAWHFPMDFSGYMQGFSTLSEALEATLSRMLLTVAAGSLLMWLTKKTDSVWPAVISHMAVNSVNDQLAGLLDKGGLPDNMGEADISGALYYLPLILAGIVFTGLLLLGKRKQLHN